MSYLATISMFGFPGEEPAEFLAIYRRMGCCACQYFRNIDNPPDPGEARRIAEDAGLPFDSIHGLFGPAHDPSSPDESVRRSAIETYRREGELALTLAAPMVVVHPTPATTQDSDTDGRSDAMRRSMEELSTIGEQQGVVYLIENLPPHYLIGNNPMQLAQMIRELNHPNLRMCLDTGHAQMAIGAARAIEACGDVIAYMHVHDNHGQRDDHLIPGEGVIDCDAFSTHAASLPPNTPAMLELFINQAMIQAAIDAGLARKLTRWLGL